MCGGGFGTDQVIFTLVLLRSYLWYVIIFGITKDDIKTSNCFRCVRYLSFSSGILMLWISSAPAREF